MQNIRSETVINGNKKKYEVYFNCCLSLNITLAIAMDRVKQ